MSFCFLTIIVSTLFTAGGAMQTAIGTPSVSKEMTLDSLCYIASNGKISYKEKLRLFYGSNYCEEAQRDVQTSALYSVLAESKRRNDPEGLLLGYSYLAYLNDEWKNYKLSRLYIDSAEMYVEQASNTLALARFHYLKGIQALNTAYGRKEGHRWFEKAMDLYIASNYTPDYLSYITYNISIYSAHQPDPVFIDKMLDRVQQIAAVRSSPFFDYTLCVLKSSAFRHAFNSSHEPDLIDSVIFYENKRISLYVNNVELFRKNLDYELLNSYLLVAEFSSLKSNPDRELIYKCIESAKAIGCDNDDFNSSRIAYTESVFQYHNGMYAKAEMLIGIAEERLNSKLSERNALFPTESFYQYAATYYALHSRILSALKRDEEAYEYNSKKNAMLIRIRDIETQELEQLYNTDKEENKIERLKKTNATQVKITTILVFIALLFIATLIMLRLWFSHWKNNSRQRSALMKAEKEEAELNLKIKEEQVAKAQLEKYEVLSEYRLRELDIESRNRDIINLQKEKEALDKQIDTFTQRIHGHISSHEKKDIFDESAQSRVVINDVEKRINRRLHKKQEYLDLLKTFDNNYLQSIRNLYDGNISFQYLQYCLCFALGMDVSEVAQCFSIEPKSVHTIRYRLKKKLGLRSGNDDLNMFLRRLNGSYNNNVASETV
jgi:hypothetical protein